MTAIRPLQLPSSLSFLPQPPAVTAIYQRFSSREEGAVENIITAGDGVLVQREAGVTFRVGAHSAFGGSQRL